MFGGMAQTSVGAEPTGGSNTCMDNIGIFNTALDGGSSANIGEINAIYTLGKSSLNYDLGEASTLFGVYANQTAGAVVGGLTWNYVASGLIGGLGVTGKLADGAYYVQLDASGGGVETTPTTVHNPGDANGDGKVDINDLTIVLSNFGQTGCAWSQGSIGRRPRGQRGHQRPDDRTVELRPDLHRGHRGRARARDGGPAGRGPGMPAWHTLETRKRKVIVCNHASL